MKLCNDENRDDDAKAFYEAALDEEVTAIVLCPLPDQARLEQALQIMQRHQPIDFPSSVKKAGRPDATPRSGNILTYSSAILKGLEARGIAPSEVQSAAELTSVQYQEILNHSRILSSWQVRQIEDASGLTGGQLAALALQPEGGPLAELAEMWANARNGVEVTARE